MNPIRSHWRTFAAVVTGAAAGFFLLTLPAPRQVAAQPRTPEPELLAAQDAAGDAAAPGPLQPIPFSHAWHAGKYEIECLYCHTGTDRSAAAGVPSVELCMGCHSQFQYAKDEEGNSLEPEGVKTLKQYWENKAPIPWQQIHRLPEHVQFRHNRHVAAGVECQTCHGPVETMDKVHLTSDTVWWPWLLPSKKLEMGWCIQCHRENEASQDCLLCHY